MQPLLFCFGPTRRAERASRGDRIDDRRDGHRRQRSRDPRRQEPDPGRGDVAVRPRRRGAGRHRGRRRCRAEEAGARQPPCRAPGGRVGHPDQPAVQAHLAGVPSRGHGDPRARCGDRRRVAHDDGRTVLRGEPGAAAGDGRRGEGRGRDHPARRRVQAAHQSRTRSRGSGSRHSATWRKRAIAPGSR